MSTQEGVLRLNIYVNCEEHPALFEHLSKVRPTFRASVLKQLADFAVWAKGSAAIQAGEGLPASAPEAQTKQTSQQTPKPPAHSTPSHRNGVTNMEAPTSRTVPANAKGSLDASVLDGVDLGGLD